MGCLSFEDKCMCNPALKRFKGCNIYHVRARRTPIKKRWDEVSELLFFLFFLGLFVLNIFGCHCKGSEKKLSIWFKYNKRGCLLKIFMSKQEFLCLCQTLNYLPQTKLQLCNKQQQQDKKGQRSVLVLHVAEDCWIALPCHQQPSRSHFMQRKCSFLMCHSSIKLYS